MPSSRGSSGGTGLAAARELSDSPTREAKMAAGSKTAEAKTRSVDEKIASSEEKVSVEDAIARRGSEGGGGGGAAAAAGGGGGGASSEARSPTRSRSSSEHKVGGGVAHQEGDIVLPPTIKAQRIMDGFRIVSMNMSDAHTGEVVWQSQNWEGRDFEQEAKAYVPKRILACKEVAREITFYSEHLMENFRLEQRVFFQGACIEEWLFEFGFVIPRSTNSWQQSIEAADEMYPAELLSGNITFETAFYDGDTFISKSVVRIYYVD